MKNKTPLLLIEQTIMLLILIVAAALCLRIFAWSDARATDNQNRDNAILQLQSAAEVLKDHQGDFSAAAKNHGGTADLTQWHIAFDAGWSQTNGDAAYQLLATHQDAPSYLGCALLEISDSNGTVLETLTVCWQEDAP